MSRRKLLVTGGAGFIGANFVHYWLDHHPEDRVVVLDALTYAGNRASLAAAESRPQFRFVEGDICDAALVARLMADEVIDLIIHFAAESHVDRSILGPAPFVQTNFMGTFTLLEAAREAWLQSGRANACRFHHVSTDEVFGSLVPGADPFTEESRYDPSSPYAASKAAADHLVRAYVRTYRLPATLSNCSNNYGPYQFPEKLIPLMIVNALHGTALPVYGDGRNRRDWLHVGDHCRALDLVLERGGQGRTYNIGARSEVANIDLVRTLCDLLDESFRAEPALRERYPACPAAAGARCGELITFVTDRPGHDLRYAIDPALAESELGFRPAHTLDAGLRSTLRWYLDNEDWWRPLLNESYRDWMRRAYRRPE